MKRILAFLLCSILLFCFTACDKNTGVQGIDTTTQPTKPTTGSTEAPTAAPTEAPTAAPTEVPTAAPTEAPTAAPTAAPTQAPTAKPTTVPTKAPTEAPTDVATPEQPDTQTFGIFNTTNIQRITFYGYYGSGAGKDVPAEHLEEIIAWLSSFEVDEDRKVPNIAPPGTNHTYVEITYFDGTTIKQPIDTITVDGVNYYIRRDAVPNCYYEIIA